jgi:2-methylcitrate dehydratase PrpD
MTPRDPFPATQRLADFVAQLDYSALPEDVRAQLVVTLIDYFRVASAGTSTPWVRQAADALLALGGEPQSALLFSDRRIDPVRAAYLNGVISGSLEWDDTHVGAMLHPGVVVWPAAFAIGERTGASGREVAAAVVAGYETIIRIGLSIQPSHFRRGFQSTATCGVFGSAAAAAKLLGLDASRTRDAMGLAASYASGTTQFFLSGSEVKRLHAGKASAAGVECALFAHAGLSGPRDAIEGAQGFASALADAFDPFPIEDGLGSRFRILDLTLKPHACSARLQAAIEAACDLAREGARTDDVAAVEIGIPAVIEGRLTLNDPPGLQQAQMSVPFAVALALHLTPERAWPPTLSLDDFGDYVGDERVRSLSRRTRCVIDPEIERATTPEYVPARVTLDMRDGSRREKSVLVPRGSPRRPMSLEEVSSRFRTATLGRASSSQIDGWLTQASDFAHLPRAAELMKLRLAASMPGATP